MESEENISNKNKEEYKLELKGISKTFPGVKALNRVSFNIYPREVHALIGENGAGKSTMIKIISGIYQPDEGEIFLNGEQIKINSPIDSIAKGIKVVYQELNLVPELSVAENIFLGGYPIKRVGIIKWGQMCKKAKDILTLLGLDIDPKTKVGKLKIAEQQIIEIARSLSHGSEVLIMDEPTSSLSADETYKLFKIIHNLRKTGVSVIYVSHKLEEVFRIADRITVLRDGKYIVTKNAKETTVKELIHYMVGYELEENLLKTNKKLGKPVLSVKNINSMDVKDISFDLHEGEILGIFGLLGSGKEKLGKLIFGIEPIISGEIFINGKKIKIKSPSIAKYNGLGLLTEDRREEGIIPELSVKDNITLAYLKDFARGGWLLPNKERKTTKSFINRLNIKTSSIFTKIKNLSGGNQQKVIIARWMVEKQKILIIVEPTRGIDVGAKVEIHKLIIEMANSGMAIIVISSEVDEIKNISDRVLIIYKGQISKEISNREATSKKLLEAAIGSM